MVDTVHQFNSVFLGSSGGSSQGHLRIHSDGFSWRSPGAGKSLDISREDVRGLVWTRIPRGYQLGIKRNGGTTVNLQGFREMDGDTLRDVARSFEHTLKEEAMSVSGRNWGTLEVDGPTLTFRVDGNPAFEVPLPEVTSAQQNRDEVVFEFQADDTSAGNGREDSLVGMSFHIPPTNEEYGGTMNGEDEESAAKKFLDQVMVHTDTGAGGSSADAVAGFDDVAVMVPRGRFSVEMHLSMVKLVGQTQEYKIKYSSIVRLFVLPKINTPHTLVIMSLDPPIRKGQTYYTHILCQFQSSEEATVELDMSEEAISARNEKLGGKLAPVMSGNIYDVFVRCLRGLAGARVTRTGKFINATGGGPAVRCSYKADEGYLYPLEKAFFYIQKPPLLLSHEEIDNVEFQRQGTGVVTASAKTFDLVFRLKNQTEHQFRGIQRTEWQNLFDFISEKQLKIENFKTAQQGPGGPGSGLDIGDDIDPGMAHMHAEESDEEEDSDFKMDSSDDDGGEPTTSEDSEGDSKLLPEDAADSQGGQEVRATEVDPAEKVVKQKKKPTDAVSRKRMSVPEETTSVSKKHKPTHKRDGEQKDMTGKNEKKRQHRKKDKNAPKKAMTAFLVYSNEHRQRVREENPDIQFKEIGSLLGQEWKALSAEEKVKYNEIAAKDKERYVREMGEYRAKIQQQNEAGEEGE